MSEETEQRVGLSGIYDLLWGRGLPVFHTLRRNGRKEEDGGWDKFETLFTFEVGPIFSSVYSAC